MSEAPTRDPEFWSRFYLDGHTPWALGQPSPPIFAWLDASELAPGRACVVGCGTGAEPVALARRGFEVVGLDLSPIAAERARALAAEQGAELEVLVGDVLDPPEELRGTFDYVLEQTCYCAIHPSDRGRYREGVWSLLRPGGRLFGVFFDVEVPEPPPFGIGLDELREDFRAPWVVEALGRATGSAPGREGKEWLACFRKPDDA